MSDTLSPTVCPAIPRQAGVRQLNQDVRKGVGERGVMEATWSLALLGMTGMVALGVADTGQPCLARPHGMVLTEEWIRSIGFWTSWSERLCVVTMTNTRKSDQSQIESTRTTLSIDNDVLMLIRQRAEVAGTSLGKTVSDMIRRSTVTTDVEPRFYNGIRLLPKRGNRVPVTLELVNELLNDDEEEVYLARNPAPDENDETVIPRRPNEAPVTMERVNALRDDDL